MGKNNKIASGVSYRTELYKACINIINSEEFEDLTFINGFERGASWALETLLEKAHWWLGKQLDGFTVDGKKVEFIGKEKFIESFKKALKYEIMDKES